ncbi:MAG: response regulator transcription factor [Cryomorphaceae bacterium]|nr:response regulator transcription factor [Cryomorphaceae bacterium]
MIQAILIDDEKNARESLNKKLELFCPEVSIIGEAESIDTALALFEEAWPHLIFLDIHLGNSSGFDLLEQLPTQSKDRPLPEVIFITAHDEYAIRAIKFSALDYLLKPIDTEELVKAIRKFQDKHEVDSRGKSYDLLLENLQNINKQPKRIMIPAGDGMQIFKISDIIRCESSSNYTYFHIKGGTRLMASKTLKEFDNMLSPYSFERVHKSHLVNLEYAVRYLPSDGGYLVLEDGSSIPVANRKKERLMRLFRGK